MQPDKIQKFQSLINASAILNDAEKREWLALLELMNDKQMLELERLLTATRETKQETGRISASPLSLAGSGEGKVAHLPPLSHIVNMPSGFTPKFEPHKESDISSQPRQDLTGQVREREKAGGRFWQKIKDVLAEKELPAGHLSAMEELELPSASIKYQVSSIREERATSTPKIPVPMPKRKQLEQPLTTVPKIQAISEILQKSSLLSVPKAATANLEEKVKSTPTVKLPEVPQDRNLEGFEPPGPARDLRPAKNSIPSALAKAILAAEGKPGLKPSISPVSPSLQGAGKTQASKQLPVQADTVKITESKIVSSAAGDLSSLTELKISDFTESNAPALIKKLKNLVLQYDYHQVVFNLEKSPLYKAYLNTGTQILSQKTDFSQLVHKDPQSNLSQETFERFADLLMGIQTG